MQHLRRRPRGSFVTVLTDAGQTVDLYLPGSTGYAPRLQEGARLGFVTVEGRPNRAVQYIFDAPAAPDASPRP